MMLIISFNYIDIYNIIIYNTICKISYIIYNIKYTSVCDTTNVYFQKYNIPKLLFVTNIKNVHFFVIQLFIKFFHCRNKTFTYK